MDATPQETLLRILRSTPALALPQLRERSGLAWGAFHQHLKELEASGAVRVVRVGRRAWVADARSAEPDEALRGRALLGNRSVAAIARAIARRGARDVPTLMASCGTRERITYHHLKRLRAFGLVRSTHALRHENLAPTSLLLRLLEEMDAGARGP